MANKSYEVIVAVVLGSLARPLFENIKEYTVVVEASSPEEAEMKACKIVADDPEKFDPLQHRIRIAEIKAVDGSSLVYKDDDQTYRKLARALRPYRMWPYLERCKEFAVDYCVYSGLSVDEAAKFIAADPEVASSPAREARGNKLTATQEILAEVKRQNAIRYERAQQPKEEKTSSESAEKKEPLYPEAGPERYHQMDPEVAAKLAKISRPETVVSIESAKEETKVKKQMYGSKTVEIPLEYKDKTVKVLRRITFSIRENGFIIGSVYKDIVTDVRADNVYDQMASIQSVRVGTWSWSLIRFPLPQFKPTVGMNPGSKNITAYCMAIKDMLKQLGIQSSSELSYAKHNCQIVDQSAPASLFNAGQPAPEVDNSIPSESSFFEDAV